MLSTPKPADGIVPSPGEVPETYGWYLEMLIGVERFTRYVCGREYIWESVPFPKVPGVVSP